MANLCSSELYFEPTLSKRGALSSLTSAGESVDIELRTMEEIRVNEEK